MTFCSNACSLRSRQQGPDGGHHGSWQLSGDATVAAVASSGEIELEHSSPLQLCLPLLALLYAGPVEQASCQPGAQGVLKECRTG